MKYYFWILGCAMNYSDGERIATVLNRMGYSRTLDENEANLFIVISCSVRQSAMNRIFGKVKDLNERKKQEPNFRTILSGCVLEKDKKKLKKAFDVMFEIKDLDKLPELITSLRGTSDEAISERDCRASLAMTEGNISDYLSLTPDYESTFRAYVPISTGCDNFCSYCAVPYTRGREKSRPADEIIAEVQNLVKKGYKEITLLGQNVNSYGNDLLNTVIPVNAGIHVDPRDKHEDDKSVSSRPASRQGGLRSNNNAFIKLLKNLDEIPGDHRIYFYSNHPKDMSDELIETLATLNHFPRYIHLPLQAGNNEILKKMNRHNTKLAYLELVERIRKVMPDVNLTTDIIVGFPGETEEMFQDTVDVMEKAEYDMAFIAQYSPRPGTVSAKLEDDIPGEKKKRRAEILQKILVHTAGKHNQKLVGTTQKVLIDEEKHGKYYGRTEGYKVVEIKTDQPLQIGRYTDIKIEKTERMKLLGSIQLS